MTQAVVMSLVERRQAVLREISINRQEIARCEKALSHIEATIRLFEPEFFAIRSMWARTMLLHHAWHAGLRYLA